jgi:TonB-dependent starch-binding outer membrane protein SusC
MKKKALRKHPYRGVSGCITKTLLVVKLTIILLTVAALHVSAKGTSQTVSFSGKDVSLEKVFKAIRQQTDYVVFFDYSALEGLKPITLDVKNTSLKDFLDQALKGQSLGYYIKKKTIFITRLPEAVVSAHLPDEFAAVLIRGIIKDENGKPLAGANVTNKNTNTVVATDSTGFFSINAAAGDVLVITFVGYQRTEYKITRAVVANPMLSIALQPSEASMDNVIVIAVGYGTLNKKEVSSAITHLSSKDLNAFAGNGVLNSIQGKVAGLSVTNTAPADPNSSPNIQLRGVSSRIDGLGPLYVINGIAGGNVDNLNQNDIESIDVLKGGAASAIYGTRGSNGVIIITTKKGINQPKAFYDGYVGIDMPTNQIKVLSRDQFVKNNQGVDYGGNTNWFDAVRRDIGFQHKHTVQFSGGNTKTNYIISFDYRDAKGLDLRSTKTEYGGRLNLNHTSANNLYSVAINIAPRYLKSNNANYNAFSQGLTLNPTLPVKDTTNPNRYLYINTGFPGAYNPVEDLKTVLDGTEGKYLDWSAAFKLNISKNLNTQVTLAEQTGDFFDFDFTPSYNTGAINGNAGRNSAGRKYSKSDQKTFEWIGNYSLDVKRHSFKLVGGYSYNYFNYSDLSGSNQNIPSDVLTYNNLGSGAYNLPIPNGASGDITFRSVGSSKNDSKLIAFFGRLNYDLAKKYYLAASLRREGSSKFGYDHKWGYFPAVSAGWMVSKEPFFPVLPWLNELKLRADYGVTGNQNFGNYLSLDTYAGYGFYSYNGASYQVWGPNHNTNYDLRWEKALNFNAGLDFELFNGKLTGSLNYYVRKNKDLLGNYNVPLPPNIMPQTYANVGTMKNSGLEIQLKGNAISSKDLTWSIAFAGATNENEFVSFSNNIYRGQPYVDVVPMPSPGSPGLAQRLQEGKRIGSFYMLRSAGIDATGRLLVYNKDGKVIPGNLATLDDRQFVGNGLPKFTASLGNTITYKKLDLSVYLRGAFGYDLFNTLAFYAGTPVTQKGANTLVTAYDGGKYAALTNPDTYSTLTDYFLEKGDFVKIDNVTLGYNFKSHVKYIDGGRFYVTGRNLYTFTKFTTGDPESIQVNGLYPGINTSNSNATLSYYPSTIQIVAGVQLKF